MLSNLPEVESTKLWFKPRQPGPATNYSVPSKEKQWDIILGHILPLFNGCQSILPFLLNLNNGKRGVPSILIYWISIFLGWAWLFFFFLLPSSPENFLPEALGGGAGALLLHWGRGCRAASYSAATHHKETQSLEWLRPWDSDSWSWGCRKLKGSSWFRPVPTVHPPTPRQTAIAQITSHPPLFPTPPLGSQTPPPTPTGPETKASPNLINQRAAVSTALYAFRPGYGEHVMKLSSWCPVSCPIANNSISSQLLEWKALFTSEYFKCQTK